MLQILFRQYLEAPQTGCVFVIHLLILMQTMTLNEKLIGSLSQSMIRYQMLILIVIDSLKLKYLLMLKLIQVQRYSMMLTMTRMLIQTLMSKLILM